MSEKELGKKLDRCLADGVVKLGRTWPITLFSGAGLGMAYANCQHDLRSHYLLHTSEQVSLDFIGPFMGSAQIFSV
uniref:MICOS complex subunit MIC10-like n=1 Tax=Poecilia reticulata TaxID=8081 RepID=A0A3P9P733_POERE